MGKVENIYHTCIAINLNAKQIRDKVKSNVIIELEENITISEADELLDKIDAKDSEEIKANWTGAGLRTLSVYMSNCVIKIKQI